MSCFATDFARTHDYRNDLAALGRYHRQYRRLTDHWLAVCPLAQIEIRYEELVADQEATSRRMIDFLGLDWHPDCLDSGRMRPERRLPDRTGNPIRPENPNSRRIPPARSLMGKRWRIPCAQP